MKTKTPLKQLKLNFSSQKTPITGSSTPRATSQDGDLLLNQKTKEKQPRDKGTSPSETSSKRATRVSKEKEKASESQGNKNPFYSKKILPGRYIDWDWAQGEGHLDDLFELFSNMGWVGICQLNNKVYDELVYEFYNNLRLSPCGTFMTTKVLNKRLEISQSKIDAVIKFPNFSNLYVLKNNFSEYPLPEISKAIINELWPKEDAKKNLNANRLPPLFRIAHKLICLNIMPRNGGHDRVTNSQLDVLEKLSRDPPQPISLGDLIMKYMLHVASTKSTPCYGRLISLLLEMEFKNFKSIFPSAKSYKEPSLSTMMKMMHYEIVNGYRVRASDKQKAALAEEEQERELDELLGKGQEEEQEEEEEGSDPEMLILIEEHLERANKEIQVEGGDNIEEGSRKRSNVSRLDELEKKVKTLYTDVKEVKSDIEGLKTESNHHTFLLQQILSCLKSRSPPRDRIST